MAASSTSSAHAEGAPSPTSVQNEDKIKQENVHTSNHKRQKSRHRASVACASCRDRRIRCVVPEGESECTQCKRSGVECIIKNDDERRRPISRAYMCSLTDRVALLEGMLRENGTEPPPANHPPKSRHAPRDQESSPQRPAAQLAPNPPLDHQSSPSSQHEEFLDIDHSPHDGSSHHSDDAESVPSPSLLAIPRKEGMVSRLLSTRGHLSFDQLSGRLRYFGPTTNCHVHGGSEVGPPMEDTRDSLEQARRAEKTIRMLSLETYDYLMDLFWQKYNSVLHVIHQEAFNEDREHGRTQFYSGFLHVCILAMGYRFADKSRPDMQRIALPQRESTLHREAKYMLDYELERPGGLTSVAALLLLGDLECGIGRDNLGWMYGGMAVRLAFDIGLHLDSRNSGLPEREIELRQMTLWACVIYDKYWALFLGRPTSMKSSDLEVYHLAKQFERLGTCRPAGVQKTLETQIYEALLDLMELAGRITENVDPRSQHDTSVDRDAYLRMAALDREFNSWYSRLPEPLRWTPANIRTAPFSFFLLHQQYHSALILLHRPYALYEDPAVASSSEEESEGNGGAGTDSHFSALSRTVCTKHAIRVARIFWQHRQRFDTRQICVTALQHAGTAATALVAALAFLKDNSSRNDNMQYLEVLSASLNDMAYTYQPAERMASVLTAVMAELRGVPVDTSSLQLFRPNGSTIPARRGSTITDGMLSNDFKRRQKSNSRPRARMGSPSKSLRSASFNSMKGRPMDLSTSAPPSSFQKVVDSDHDRLDGFVMVTPRSEIGSWLPPSSVSGDHSLPSNIDPNLATPASSATPSSRNAHTWMGAADVDASDLSIAQLASIHFPEIPNLTEDSPGMTSGSMGPPASVGNDNSHLDFMNLGGDDWREWQTGGSDIDAYSNSGFGFGNAPLSNSGHENRFGSVMS